MDTDETQICYPQIARIFADFFKTIFICVNPRNLRRPFPAFNLCFICAHLWLDNENMAQIQIHQRRVEQKAVEQIQDAADAGEKFPGIFHARLAFEQ